MRYIVIFIVILLLVIGYYLVNGDVGISGFPIFKTPKMNAGSLKPIVNTFSKDPSVPPEMVNEPYINPMIFDIGLMSYKKYKTANLCNPDILYPINGLGPEYGWTMPENCPMARFVRAP